MNNFDLQDVLKTGAILVDSRGLKNTSLSQFLTNFILTLNKLGAKMRIGLVVPEESQEKFEKIFLDYDEKIYELSYFFYVHGKLNFENPHNDHLKHIFKKNNTLFLTQDQSIAFEVANLSNEYNQIYVRRASTNSLLEAFPVIIGDTFSVRPTFSYIHGRSPRIDKIPQDCNIPKVDDIVYINDKPVKLCKLIGSGGEGKVYEINDEIVAKIYNRERLTKTIIEKISTMCKKRVSDYSICWPINEVKNHENFIVGYTMKKCVGKPISTLYRGSLNTKKMYPDFKDEDCIYLCLKILSKIQKLHRNNILLGDINDRNFSINSKREVFLIDTDSYQIEDYACDVGTIGYVAPELKDGILASTLRTFEDEGYAVAVFVFRTLMQGHFPFAQVGTDSDYLQLIKKQQFPYFLNDAKTKKKVPPTAYELWIKFPEMLKKMFIQTFMYNKNAKAQNRYSVEQWIIALEHFRDINIIK